jgi:hypothetical protein
MKIASDEGVAYRRRKEVVVIKRIGSGTAILVAVMMGGCTQSRAEKVLPTPAPTPAPEVRPQNADLNRSMPTSTPELQAVKMPAGPAPTVKEIVAKADAFYAKTQNYTCRVTRQERLGNTLQPVEKILMNFRAQPRSVYYRWLGDVCSGRECVWVENANDGKLISKGGKSDFGMTGRRIAVAPDGFLAKSRSRYTIHQSGQDVLVRKLKVVLDEIERGVQPADTLRYVGVEQPPELTTPLHHVVQAIPPQSPLFPNGGVRDWYFDPETGRVVVVEAKDPSGERQEYYHFEHLFANNTLTAADFDPDLMFAKPGQVPDAASAGPPN